MGDGGCSGSAGVVHKSGNEAETKSEFSAAPGDAAASDVMAALKLGVGAAATSNAVGDTLYSTMEQTTSGRSGRRGCSYWALGTVKIIRWCVECNAGLGAMFHFLTVATAAEAAEPSVELNTMVSRLVMAWLTTTSCCEGVSNTKRPDWCELRRTSGGGGRTGPKQEEKLCNSIIE